MHVYSVICSSALTGSSVQNGMRSFRKGDVAASVKEFDEAMRLDPGLRPYLWQRGLSLYYAGTPLSNHL